MKSLEYSRLGDVHRIHTDSEFFRNIPCWDLINYKHQERPTIFVCKFPFDELNSFLVKDRFIVVALLVLLVFLDGYKAKQRVISTKCDFDTGIFLDGDH